MMEAIPQSGPELVIGLVGAIGVDLESVALSLKKAFDTVAYQTRRVRLMDVLVDNEQPSELKRDKRYMQRMDTGNRFRQTLERDDALALLAVVGIQKERESVAEDVDVGATPDVDKETKPIPRCAYILHSLKTKGEVKLLRQIYGDSCYVVAAYASRESRRTQLAKAIGRSYYSEWRRYLTEAESLILRDEHERIKLGQNVRDTFSMADVFLDASDSERLERGALRFVELLFSHPFRTPTRDEHAMFQAFGAELRSASAGRQVGASIATTDGEIVAVGTNEVAKAHGGQYWGEEKNDHRDHMRPADSSAAMAEGMLADLLARLHKKDWLVPEKTAAGLAGMLELVQQEKLLDPMDVTVADSDAPPSLAESARIQHVIEFIRAVHAEMAALMTAARRGVAVEGCTLYSTSFPCHECARHIVAAGIARVVFIMPYPKSRVQELYDDSICIDEHDDSRVPFEAFIGIAPRLYAKLFAMPDRKDGDSGRWVDWESIRQTQQPRYAASPDSYYLVKEKKHLSVLRRELTTRDVTLPLSQEIPT